MPKRVYLRAFDITMLEARDAILADVKNVRDAHLGKSDRLSKLVAEAECAALSNTEGSPSSPT